MPVYHCKSSISLFTHFQLSLSCLCWLEYLPDLIISTLNQIILQRLNSNNQMRNHRLEINIEQLEKYQHQQPDTYHPLYPHSQQQQLASQNSEDGKPSAQDQPQDEGYDEGQEQQAFDDRSGGQASQLQQSSNRIYQSVETFGNIYDIKKQLSKLAQFSNHQSNNNQQQQKYKLTETPLDPINFNRAQHSQLRLIELQKSNADDEVNRIINKVLMKDRQTGSLRAQDKAQKHSRKIDKINQELLSQNTRLIERVNSLQKKIQRLAVKMRVKTKSESRIKHENIPTEINQQLKQRLKKYKQKLSQALHLNSKLSSRHKTEKSISRLNGQLNRDSINNRVNRDIREDKEMNPSSLGVMSTIRSNTLREDLALSKRSNKDNTFNAHHISHLHEKAVCQKCHKKILKDAKDESRQKRGLFSPVLQFKNYEIKEEVNNLSESLAESKMLGKQIKDWSCQTEQNQGNNKRRLEQLDGQQRRLQQMVKGNNARIQQHQELLFRLIDYG